MSWLGTYAKRIPITAKYTHGGTQRIDGTLTDRSILVYISAACGIGNAFDASCVFDELENDANALKIAVTVGETTECNVEIKQWDHANKKAWLYLRIPTLSHTADTGLYLYYDKNHAASTKDNSAGNKVGLRADGSAATIAVWTDDTAVWHLAEASGVRKDSKGTNDLTDYNTVLQGIGQVGDKCADFERANGEALYILDNADISLGDIDFTFEMWFRLESANDQRLIAKDDYLIHTREYMLFLKADGTIVYGVPGGAEGITTDTFGIETWHYLAFYHDAAANKMWLQKNIAAPHETAIVGGFPDSDGRFILGGFFTSTGWWANRALDGMENEVRLSKTLRNDAWRKVSYYSDRDDLLTWGSEETNVATYTRTYTADSLFKKLGLTETLDADTLLKKLGILQTLDVDALLQKGLTRTFLAKAILGASNISELTADVLFKALGLTQTLDVDALLQQQDITETLDADALFKLIATQSIDADALLRAALSQTVDADTLFQKLGLTQDVDVDALFLKSVTEAILADLLLQNGLTKGVDVDALLRGALTKTFTADLRLGKYAVDFTASVYFQRLPYHVILDAQYITETPEVNRAYVIGRDAEGNAVYGTDLEQSEIDLVGERLDFTLALSVPSSSQAADVADAMLKKQRLSKHRGFITIPPNAGAELWDVIQLTDKLCAQSASNYRVVAISFDYQPRQRRYQHKLFLAAR